MSMSMAMKINWIEYAEGHENTHVPLRSGEAATMPPPQAFPRRRLGLSLDGLHTHTVHGMAQSGRVVGVGVGGVDGGDGIGGVSVVGMVV